jgi:hypothetical protein
VQLSYTSGLGKKSYPEEIRHLLLGPAGSGDVDHYVDEHEVELWNIRAEERIYFLNTGISMGDARDCARSLHRRVFGH